MYLAINILGLLVFLAVGWLHGCPQPRHCLLAD